MSTPSDPNQTPSPTSQPASPPPSSGGGTLRMLFVGLIIMGAGFLLVKFDKVKAWFSGTSDLTTISQNRSDAGIVFASKTKDAGVPATSTTSIVRAPTAPVKPNPTNQSHATAPPAPATSTAVTVVTTPAPVVVAPVVVAPPANPPPTEPVADPAVAMDEALVVTNASWDCPSDQECISASSLPEQHCDSRDPAKDHMCSARWSLSRDTVVGTSDKPSERWTLTCDNLAPEERWHGGMFGDTLAPGRYDVRNCVLFRPRQP